MLPSLRDKDANVDPSPLNHNPIFFALSGMPPLSSHKIPSS
jgi:hypothetical protein